MPAFFMWFLRALDASVCNYAIHPQDMSLLRSVNTVYYPPNCSSMLQLPDVRIIKCFKAMYRKNLVCGAITF
jgi:hypothetical protein